MNESNLKEQKSTIEEVMLEGEAYFRIPDSDSLRPFFMSIVSDSNHWMFISSNGGLTAGRKNAEYSLFPYYTDDKITESADITGSKSIFRVTRNGNTHLWEPFSNRMQGAYRIQRNLYKNIHGNKIVFEEINQDLEMAFRYQWASSNLYGFVREARLTNQGNAAIQLSMVDGIQNILPFGVGADLQNRQSNLVDAYKRSELLEGSGIGIYALSAIIVDRAEPSEALKANIAWSLGLEDPSYLLSSLQLDTFRNVGQVLGESDVKAEKGAYLLHTTCEIPAGASKSWSIIANVNQDHAAIAEIAGAIREDAGLAEKVANDIEKGTRQLIRLCAESDGIQRSQDRLRDTRHFSNTLFNIMRGGIFDDAYRIEKWDFKAYLRQANKDLYTAHKKDIESLPEVFELDALQAFAESSGNPDLKRLSTEYLPLKFSRRHGDPSRPWNVFSINTRSELDGSKILDYQGNWRDIFQNWEALARSFPEFIEGMIFKFLNASTFDGYNPYRVTKDGFDWEIIEPDDPWSYIGYWGDHQIIYLLKFLEFAQALDSGKLAQYFDQDVFVYANVPYRIKSYPDLLRDPKDTIEFDSDLDRRIREDREATGADGALIKDRSGSIYRVNFIEKILATVLAKVSNFIPEGGIWMNTQRPEWNDANNALVGNGVSMVTLYYLRRFMAFFGELLETSELEQIPISKELHAFFKGVNDTLRAHVASLDASMDDRERKRILDGLGQAGSQYRDLLYATPFSGEKESIALSSLKDWTALTLIYLEHSIRANKREDQMYHAYNLMSVEGEDEVSISYLDEMLEGQVAVLSSHYLNAKESLGVLDGMRNSRLFREDQYSYLLYPNKELHKFWDKNRIPESKVSESALLREFLEKGHTHILVKDRDGGFHFNGNFRNAGDLSAALDALPQNEYSNLNDGERKKLLAIFEEVFNHKAFTGRSGTFFGYEGLGSIYWHMVSKLLLAVQETCLRAISENADAKVVGRLLDHYYEINEGIGVHKPPSLYGAFPTDPYSHTPMGKGAQQPGMTGQVKEDILSRFGELGIFMHQGQLIFKPALLRKNEFLEEASTVLYVDVNGERREVELQAGTLFFTVCQVPVTYVLSDSESMVVRKSDGSEQVLDSLQLDPEYSDRIFRRTGEVVKITVMVPQSELK